MFQFHICFYRGIDLDLSHLIKLCFSPDFILRRLFWRLNDLKLDYKIYGCLGRGNITRSSGCKQPSPEAEMEIGDVEVYYFYN